MSNNNETPISSVNETNKSSNQVTLSTHNLFVNKKLFPLLLRFIIPAILVSIFQALYVFADQIMMIKFIPQGTLNPDGLTIENLVGANVYQNYLEALKHLPGEQVALNTDDLIRAAVSISAPITVILNGVTLLISMGVAVSYAKALGKNDVNEIEKV